MRNLVCPKEGTLARHSGIGLDIGSSAVRAAEVSTNGGREQIVRFGQVGLPSGAVVEGEVRDVETVISAVRRLWDEAGFKSKEVVLGINSQRAMVRTIDVPSLKHDELRPALRFQIGELLPIPIDLAVYDFAVVGPDRGDGGEGQQAKALVVAAQRDIVTEALGVVSKAGLRARAIDASPLAMLRAIPPGPGGGLEAVVSLGAQLVTVGVRQGSAVRFLRTVTAGLESQRDMVDATARSGQTGPASGGQFQPAPLKLQSVVEEVRGSLEYYLSHNHGELLQRVVVTGGGALYEGIIESLRAAVSVPVSVALVGAQPELDRLQLGHAQLEEASVRWSTAVGLALWGTGTAPAPSLLPAEVKERRQFRQALVGSAAGLVIVALGLSAVSVSKVHTASSIEAQIGTENAQAAVLNADIAKLQYVTRLQQQIMSARQLSAKALAGDIDWVGLVHRIGAALPPYVHLTSLALDSSTGAGATATGSPGAAGAYVGTIAISATTTEGTKSVATIIDRLSAVPGVGAVWVPSATSATPATGAGIAAGVTHRSASTTTAAGGTSFTVQADVTAAALSHRSNQLPGGKS